MSPYRSAVLTISLASLPSAAAPLGAQQPPEITTLSQPQAEFAEPFSSLVGLRELSDGRVIVADRLEKAVRALDFRSGTVRDIGRVGSGPGEFQMPGALLPLPGDSTLLVDFGNMRLTVITPSGRMSESTSMLGTTGELRNPSFADGSGRLYFTATGGLRPGSEGPPDSVAIVVWQRAADRTDTLAVLPAPQATVSMRSSGGGGALQFRGIGPLAPRHGWAVDVTGRLATVWPEDYHLEWIVPPGTRRVSPPVPYEPVPVSEEDKQAWASGLANTTAVMMTAGRESGAGARTVRMPRPDPADMDWPAVKPPFDASQIRFAPDGSLWVERYGRHGAPTTVDVFDTDGRLARRIRYPDGRRFLGFGAGSIYLVRKDVDDLEWLERYGM